MAPAMRRLGFSVALLGCLGLSACPAFTPNETVSEPDPAQVRGKQASAPAPRPAEPTQRGANPHGLPPNPHAQLPNPHAAQPDGEQVESATASHILIRYAGAMRTTADIKRSKEEARKLAADVAKKAAARGADFAALANEYTEDPSGKGTGGKLGTFPKGRMVPEFDKPLFALAPGETSDVIETPFGFHIIHRER
jgi:parvulin-like peptidyl-prolyl isomerase